MRRSLLTGIAAAVLVAVTALTQVPAAAAQGFDLQTAAGAAPSDGSARASGSLSFPNRYTVTFSGRINDRCPADGYGAYLRVIGAFSNGDSISSVPIQIAADTHRCDASADGYPFTDTITRSSSRTIAWVRLTLYEINADNGDFGNLVSSQYYYNPRA